MLRKVVGAGLLVGLGVVIASFGVLAGMFLYILSSFNH